MISDLLATIVQMTKVKLHIHKHNIR